jgi:hypothetical protein
MLKKAIMALAGAVALAGAFPASATTITLPTTTASNGTIYSSYTANVAAGPFIDSYSFTLPSSAYTISTALVYALGTSISFNGFSTSNVIQLTSATLNGISASISNSSLPAGIATLTTYTASASNVPGGSSNTLTISGSAAGANAYQILIAATPAVPERETWAIMIAGMGVVGVAAMRARRRQGSAQTTAAA